MQTAVHEAEYAHVKRPIDPSTKRPLEPAHRFEVNLEGDSLSQAKYVSYHKSVVIKTYELTCHRFDLFVKYQAKVHGDDPTQLKTKDFKRFLCSGIKRSPTNPESKDRKLGSWHQCYRLDGKLIAVAVLDLVPSGVSSVYVL